MASTPPKSTTPAPQDPKPQDPTPQDSKPKDDKPKEDKPKDDKPKEDKPKEDKPKDDKPKEDKPKEDKPKEDKPKDEKPKEDKPKEDKPKDDKPKDDKPLDEQSKAGLKAHNELRLKHGCSALTWDPFLTAAAQGYADHIADINKLVHGDTQGQGQNIYWVSTGDTTFEQAVHRWAAEEKNWTPGQKYGDGNLQTYGHYTQCVWHNTTTLGMAKAKSKQGATYIVARYMPAGNVAGEQPF